MVAMQSQMGKGRVRQRGRSYGTSNFRSAAPILLAALPSFFFACSEPCEAQNTPATPHILDAPGLFGEGVGVFGLGKTTARQSTKPGISFSEILRGNGSRAGYTLSHGNVQTDTISVHVGGRTLRLNSDYWLDADSGTLI